jgi:hypothetical protein
VARFSDTKGEIKRQRDTPLYPFAWTYRDYVIKSFNEDKPFDRFILEQIAADKLPPSKGECHLAALGFLTLGERFQNNENDVINDRIDVVTKGFLGLTVSCARCHNHMFDPIPPRITTRCMGSSPAAQSRVCARFWVPIPHATLTTLITTEADGPGEGTRCVAVAHAQRRCEGTAGTGASAA